MAAVEAVDEGRCGFIIATDLKLIVRAIVLLAATARVEGSTDTHHLVIDKLLIGRLLVNVLLPVLFVDLLRREIGDLGEIKLVIPNHLDELVVMNKLLRIHIE